MSNEKRDLRSPVARMRDAWFETTEGKEACEGDASGQYLRNRLEMAYLSGYNDGAKRGIDDAFEALKLVAKRGQ
jgi:hypothetical protein